MLKLQSRSWQPLFWLWSHLWRNREELPEINLLEMGFCSFLITYQRQWDLQWCHLPRKAEKNRQPSLSDLSAAALQEHSWARTCPHTPSPSRCRPSKSVMPCRRKTKSFIKSKVSLVFFTGVFMLTRQLFPVLNQSQEENGAQTRDLLFWSVITKRRRKSHENGNPCDFDASKNHNVQIKVTTSFKALVTAA